MARNAAKSKALQPRGGIQSRLEMQKAKARDLKPATEIEELKTESTATEPTMTNVDVKADLASMVSVKAIDESLGGVTETTDILDRIPADPTDVPIQKRRGRGRPSNGIDRKSLTLRPNGETVKCLRMYASDNGYDMSDVVDVLVELFLKDERVAERLSKMKVRRRR